MLFGDSLFYSEYVTLYHDVTVFTELGIQLGSTNGEEGGFQVNHGVVHWAARLSFLFDVGKAGVYRVTAAISTLAARLVGGAGISDSGVDFESLVDDDVEGLGHCAGEADASVA